MSLPESGAVIGVCSALGDTAPMGHRLQRRGAFSLLATAVILGSCTARDGWHDSLERLLLAQPERFATVMQDPEGYRVQVIYTQIDRDQHNVPSFRTFRYRVNPREYFYPASTVKLPTALLALEKINRLDIDGLSRDTLMLTGAPRDAQSMLDSDPGPPVGMANVGHYVRSILLVSDNDAFNRLYEFLGQKPLTETLHARGFTGTRIMHRLEVSLSVDENRLTNPVTFVSGDKVLYRQGAQFSDTVYTAADPIMLGRAEVIDGRSYARPKDFAEKNAYPLEEQHDVLKTLIFPESAPPEQRFALTDDDYRFVYRNMSMYARESGIAEYSDPAAYPDSYVKFLMYGGEASHIPSNIRIFNKVGDAYGFLTDVAYIVDFQNRVEFILAATVYTNANGTFNDDTYEYEEIGLPFLRDLGQAIYEVELSRVREHLPNLDRFRFSEQGAHRKQEAERGQWHTKYRADDGERDRHTRNHQGNAE